MSLLRLGLAVLMISSLALAKKGSSQNLRDEEEKNLEARLSAQIIGGENATEAQFPWQVMIRLQGGFACGGALISPQWVLTSAYCLPDLAEIDEEFDITVRLGTTFRYEYEPGRVSMDIPLANIYIHPNFTYETEHPYSNGNIALIKLPIALVLPTKPKDASYIKAARLPKQGEKNTYVNFNGTISGWGLSNRSDSDSDTINLKHTNLTVVSSIQCSLKYRDFSPDQHFCGRDSNTNAACWGDDGGPMVIPDRDGGYTVIGINSYPACSENFTLFSRVTYFSTWIRNITKIR